MLSGLNVIKKGNDSLQFA